MLNPIKLTQMYAHTHCYSYHNSLLVYYLPVANNKSTHFHISTHSNHMFYLCNQDMNVQTEVQDIISESYIIIHTLWGL